MSQIQFKGYENAIFKARGIVLWLCVIATVFFAYQAFQVRPDTRLERLIPASHEFVRNARQFMGFEDVGGSSMLRIAVERTDGDTIFDYSHLSTLQKISDEISLLDGVDTGSLNSLWSPAMLWFSITSEGFASGPVIDYDNFYDSPEAMEQVKANAFRAGIVGSYVSNDLKASMTLG